MAARLAAAGAARLAQGREIRDQAAALAVARAPHRSVAPQAYDVDIDVGSGRRVTGTVPRVYGDRLVTVTYSKLDGRHLLESWIRLLALAARPERQWSAVCIGRPRAVHPSSGRSGPRRSPRRRARVIWWPSTTPGAASRFRCR